MNKHITGRTERLKTFLLHSLWEINPDSLPLLQRYGVKSLQFITAVTREFILDRCLLHASALAFTTIISIVPLLAIIFALLRGFGAETELEILILNHVAPGSHEAVDAIFSYAGNTSLGRLGAVGLIMLIISVLTLLTNIEQSFNHICRASETRSLTRRFSDYFSITVLGPFLLVAAISMTTTLESQALVQYLLRLEVVGAVLLILFQFLPYLAMWALFTGLYLFMPNTRIELRAALIGGAFGGIFWQLVQAAFINFQFGVSRYNAIYGTMAALPIFMLWIYASWMIVLLGLEVTFAVQSIKAIRQELRGGELSPQGREEAALAIMIEIGSAFERGLPSLTAVELSSRLQLAPRMTLQILRDLLKFGFVTEITGNRTSSDTYQPARALEQITALSLLTAMRTDGTSPLFPQMGRTGAVIGIISSRLGHELSTAMEGVTLHDLIAMINAPPDPPPFDLPE